MKNNDNLISINRTFKMDDDREQEINKINETNSTDVIRLINGSIEREIKWCINTNNQCKYEVTKEQVEWFIKGLKQARNLINCVVDELLQE
nr:MAG TPA: hypothetical protein [Caudoviricetes sp.]